MRVEGQELGTDTPFIFCDWHKACGKQTLENYLMTAMNKIKMVKASKAQ